MPGPTLYTAEIVEAICERLSKGEPMAVICRDEGMPAARTVRDWIADRADVAAAIAGAREEGEDWIAADCLRIADTPLPAVEEELDAEGKVVSSKRSDAIGHRKLQIDTRLKLLAKWNPKKYGDRQILAGDPEAPLTSHVSDEQLDARIAALQAKRAGAGGG